MSRLGDTDKDKESKNFSGRSSLVVMGLGHELAQGSTGLKHCSYLLLVQHISYTPRPMLPSSCRHIPQHRPIRILQLHSPNKFIPLAAGSPCHDPNPRIPPHNRVPTPVFARTPHVLQLPHHLYPQHLILTRPRRR